MNNQEIKVGEKIKEIRESHKLSLSDLAEKSGFTSAFLSQIENHLISPPLGVITKIASSLDIETGILFNQKNKAPFTIVRINERAATSRVASKEGVRYGYSYESLAPDKINRNMEPFIVNFEPVSKKGSAYNHDGEEFLFVLEGKIEIHLGNYTDTLEPGDSIYYDSLIPHKITCANEKPAKIIAVIYS